MKRTPIRRKPAKRRAPGTACANGRRCIAVYDYTNPRTGAVVRLCALHMADALMADRVKAEERCCRFCGSQLFLQWAHVWRRSYRAIRWHRENSMALCQTHHMMFTENPARWEKWCRDIGVPWDELRELALNGAPENPVDVIERLEAA